MAWMIRGYVDVCWVPEGTGGVTLMPTGGLGNEPGYGPGQGAGPVPNAQTMRFQQGEAIVGVSGSPPNSTAIGNALTSMATDTNSQITAAIVTAIQNWQTGSP